jgi:hypothetical protein
MGSKIVAYKADACIRNWLQVFRQLNGPSNKFHSFAVLFIYEIWSWEELNNIRLLKIN